MEARKLFVIQNDIKVRRKRYLLQTIEMLVPKPIFTTCRGHYKRFSGRYFRFECLLVPCSDIGHPMFNKSHLVELHETLEEAVHQHNRVVDWMKQGRHVFYDKGECV